MASNAELQMKIVELSKALGRGVPDLAGVVSKDLTQMVKDLKAEVAAAEAAKASDVADTEAAEAAAAAEAAEKEANEAAAARQAADEAEAAALAAAADASVLPEPKPKVVLADNRVKKRGHYVAKGASVTAPGQRVLGVGEPVTDADLALEHRKALEDKGILEFRE